MRLMRVAALALTMVGVGASGAFAGGFALKEGSTSAQGASFAGATASDGDITYSFFNPAALRSVEGVEIGFSNSAIFAHAEIDTSVGAFDSDEIGVVGAVYVGARVNEQLVLGLSINGPFGLATEWDRGWVGDQDALRTSLLTIAITPMLSYDVNPDFTLGVGFTYLYGELLFENALSDARGGGVFELEGAGHAFGFVVGGLWDVTPHVTIGVAAKSGYNFEGDGDLAIINNQVFPGVYDTDASADLPAVISIGARIGVTDDVDLLAEAQWQGWSSLDFFQIKSESPLGTINDEFGYDDALYFALGAEYAASEALVLRTGVAFDQTPTVDDKRSPRIPDGDRIWLSAGASYTLDYGVKIDLAYSFISTLESNPIPLDTDDTPGDDEVASGDGRVHILSVGASYEF